jgi:pimeloyl-ACP methyl ester carboxylesterase
LVDVGDMKLHIWCQGHGGPTVVLDAALGVSSLSWLRVQPGVAAETRVCSYDRAGLGWSEPGPSPRTSRQIVEELEALLRAAGEEPPYVLVGHSFGGINMRLFAARNPELVAGLVLVDPSHEEQRDRLSGSRLKDAVLASWGPTAPLGVPRLLIALLAGDAPEGLSQREWDMTLAVASPTKTGRAISDQYRVLDESFEQLSEVSEGLELTPVTVVSAGKPASFPGMSEAEVQERHEQWLQLHRDLVQRSYRGRHVVADGSGHRVQMEKPDIVVEAILEQVAWIRERIEAQTE